MRLWLYSGRKHATLSGAATAKTGGDSMAEPGGAALSAADGRNDPAGLRRIVVVDDEPELCRVLMEYLTKHGFRVRAAACETELDALLAAEAADVLILDINMPGEDGISIARRIHAASATPILMLTA